MLSTLSLGTRGQGRRFVVLSLWHGEVLWKTYSLFARETELKFLWLAPQGTNLRQWEWVMLLRYLKAVSKIKRYTSIYPVLRGKTPRLQLHNYHRTYETTLFYTAALIFTKNLKYQYAVEL